VETGAFFPVEQIRRWVKCTPEQFTPLFKMVAAKFLNETDGLINLSKVS